MHKWERRNKPPVEKIPNSLRRYSPFRVAECNTPLLKCGLHIVISFLQEQYMKRGTNGDFMVEKPDKPQPGQCQQSSWST